MRATGFEPFCLRRRLPREPKRRKLASASRITLREARKGHGRPARAALVTSNLWGAHVRRSLLLLVNQGQRQGRSIGVRAFGLGGHRLAVARNYCTATGGILSIRLLRLISKRIAFTCFTEMLS